MAIQAKRSPKQILRLLVGIVIGAVFAFLAFRHVDWSQTGRAIASANMGWIAIGILSLAIDYCLRIVRWRMMLRAVSADVSFGEAAVPYLASIGLNNVLPFRLGDVARAVGYCRYLRASTGQIVSTMIVERMLDLLSLLAIFFVMLQAVPAGSVSPAFVKTCTVFGSIAIFGLLALLLAPGMFERWAVRVAENGKNEKLRKVAAWFAEFFKSLMLMRSAPLAASLVLLSFGAWIFEGGVFASVAMALGHTSLGTAPWFALSTGTLGTLVPSTPGYVGTFDFFCILGFTAFGVTKQAASLMALVIHTVLWVPLTLAGMVVFGLSGAKRLSAPVGESA